MTKLEPTRTSSDLTATERLRELLDERGVHWWAGEDERKTLWESNGLTWEYFNDENGEAWLGFLGACEQDITPEQAIAATLGVTDATAARQGDASCNCSNSERTNETCLPHFWTHDGTLHVELPKLPETISVRLPAQRDREAGSARVWQYTRGSGTCEIHDCEGSFSAVNRPVWRCDCGAFMTQFTDATTYHKPRFCPNCGRKVVDA